MQKIKLNVVILAAGKGTRMRSDLPKVMHLLAGQPLLQHVLNVSNKLDPDQTVVVYGFGGEVLRHHFQEAPVIWVHQSEQLGTGHAVLQTLNHLDDDAVILALFGDVPLIRAENCTTLIENASTGSLVVLTTVVNEPSGYGRIVRNSEGKLLRIVEHKDANNETKAIREINSGIMAMPVKKLKKWALELKNNNQQKEYYLTDIVEIAVAEGNNVEAISEYDNQTLQGVNTKSDLAKSERYLQMLQAENLMAEGVTLADPRRIDIRGVLNCGRDVTIDVSCVFEGTVTLGNNVKIAANCFIRDTKIDDGTFIAPFSHLDGAMIGRSCRIGPYARLRPGTDLASETHVGNFVEIKNSRVGSNTKINHLSYVGDATVGKNVNIGAGTITCNYDGVNKHTTTIEDDVFIGSSTQLVAPVKIGYAATIGAGSTITKDAPPETLTVARSKQLSLPTWTRPKKK